METPTPRYRRRPDLDQVAAWEDLATREIRHAAIGYDLNSEEAREADAFMALPVEERPQVLEERRAAREAGLEATARAAEEAGDFYRDTLERTDLGDGLARLLGVWRLRAAPGGPIEDMGLVHIFEQLTPEGEAIELEIDTNAEEWVRLVHVLLPDGLEGLRVSAADMLELARLLARPEVREALEEWAAEDAAHAQREQEASYA